MVRGKAKQNYPTLRADEARAFLVSHLGLAQPERATGRRGVRSMFKRLGCIQLDPLDPMGTNADLVALARVDGVRRGEVLSHLLPGVAFEHFAKERCLLPMSAFPYYRGQARETPWWRSLERQKRLPEDVLRAVLDEVRQRGPLWSDELSDQGQVTPIDWSGWKGTSKAALMALEALWTRCSVVVCERQGKRKRYDIPERAVPAEHREPKSGFLPWALEHRIHAAGLLALGGSATWSMLSEAKKLKLHETLLAEGRSEAVQLEGSSRVLLAPAGFRKHKVAEPDTRMRILAPLDPLIWDRKLILDAFGFDYVWEVYKPESQRRYGWYVSPLLHRGRFVGRIAGAVVGSCLRIENVFSEPGAEFSWEALDEALERHRDACGASTITRRRRFTRAGPLRG